MKTFEPVDKRIGRGNESRLLQRYPLLIRQSAPVKNTPIGNDGMGLKGEKPQMKVLQVVIYYFIQGLPMV